MGKNLRQRRRPDRMTSPDLVARKHAITIDRIVGPLALKQSEMDRKWGTDRLPSLAPPELAQRFGIALERFEQAMMEETPDPDFIRGRVENLIRGYAALDAAAEAAGATRPPPTTWHLRVGDKPCVIVLDRHDMRDVAAMMPDALIYTAEEIEHLLEMDHFALIRATKEAFPGAEIREVRAKKPAPIVDEIPF